jgi:hypothetical protein
VIAGLLLAGFMSLCQGEARAEGTDQPNPLVSLHAMDSYTPILLFYSGDPTPQHMQWVKDFLKSNKASKEVINETLETVVYKLNNFKTGFAHPVYLSPESNMGNMCIVADGHFSEFETPLSMLASGSISRGLLKGISVSLDKQALLDNVATHELFHCFDLMKQSQADAGRQIVRDGPQYYAYYSETGADAYAALKYLRQTGDKKALMTIRDFRTLNLLNGDTAHYTSRTMDYIIRNISRDDLLKLNTVQMIALANSIREMTRMLPEEFERFSRVADELSGEYLKLVGVSKQPSSPGMQTNPLPLSRELAGQALQEIAVALNDLGGKALLANRYFSALLEKYQPGFRFNEKSA